MFYGIAWPGFMLTITILAQDLTPKFESHVGMLVGGILSAGIEHQVASGIAVLAARAGVRDKLPVLRTLSPNTYRNAGAYCMSLLRTTIAANQLVYRRQSVSLLRMKRYLSETRLLQRDCG